MILVTGAAGKTGQALLHALKALSPARSSVAVRAFVRTANQAKKIENLAQEIVIGDLCNPDDLMRSTESIERIYHICPNMHPNEFEIGESIIAAAKANGIAYVVYHSVLHPQTQDMPHHWEKLRVEELLFKSGLNYTILQPAAYMQNIMGSWQSIIVEGIYRVPYALETKLGMVDLANVVKVAVKVLTEDSSLYSGATYELACGEVLDQYEVAELLSESLQQPIRAEVIPRKAWRIGVREAGLSDYAIETLEKMFDYYEQYGFWGNEYVLSSLIGHQPDRLTAYLRHNL